MAYQPTVTGSRYMISAGHYLATQAGFEILENGGNAVDAGVAAGIALGVVQCDIVQFSGVAPIMIYLAERDEVVTVSGLGYWPAATDPRYFIDELGGKIPTGVRRTVVPAAPDAWIQALERFGTMRFGEVAAAAIRYARDGFTVQPLLARSVANHLEAYRRWPGNAAVFLREGEPPAVGSLLVQSELAASIQHMADEEAAAAKRGRAAGLAAAHDAFYRGDLAVAMVRHQAEEGGWLSREDLGAFASAIEPPVRYRYEGTDVYVCGPWCQGPVLAQMLSLLEGHDLRGLGHNSADYIHVVTEAMKLAFADREHHYGDPRFVDVPLERLLSADYAAERRRLIRPDAAWPDMPPAGLARGRPVGEAPPVAAGAPVLDPDTSYVCVVDAAGNAFSATPSDGAYGAPLVPGLGFCPSPRGSQSFAREGHPSSVAPGKRPRLTPNPALARRPGELTMPFGTPGGDSQCQGMLQVFLNVLTFGMDVQEAVEAPRFISSSFPSSFEPHASSPGRLDVEARIEAPVREALAARGHRVAAAEPLWSGAAAVCLVKSDLGTGTLWGGADPRRSTRAMGW